MMATHRNRTPRPRAFGTAEARASRREYDRNRAALHREAAEVLAPCSLCGGPILYDVAGTHPLGFTVDHVVPRSKGGGHRPDNLAPAHRECNTAKREGRNRTTPEDRSANW